MFTSLWFVYSYLPGADTLINSVFAVLGTLINSADNAMGTNFSEWFSVLNAAMSVVAYGTIWIISYFARPDVIAPLMMVFLDLSITCILMRIALTFKGHIWSASR